MRCIDALAPEENEETSNSKQDEEQSMAWCGSNHLLSSQWGKQLTIGSYVSVRSSRYETRGKFGEHERCVRVAGGVARSVALFYFSFRSFWGVKNSIPKEKVGSSPLSVGLQLSMFSLNYCRSLNQFFNSRIPKWKIAEKICFLEGFVCWLHERAQ